MNIGTILIAVLVFSVLIFVHELGHFATAKWSGIRVNEFAMGMGPKLLSFTRGETEYTLRALPIGGMCVMEGEDENSHNPRAFNNAPLHKRIITIVAGSAMNLLLGLVLLGILSSQQSLFGTTTIAQFNPDATSSQHLQIGDEVIKVNNHRVRSYNDLNYEFQRDLDGIMDFVVLRNGEKVVLEGVTFPTETVEDGIQLVVKDFRIMPVEPTPMLVVKQSFDSTRYIIKTVWGSLSDLITGRFHFRQMSGPVGVTTAISQASSRGWQDLLFLVSFITVNLGVFNMLPLPALDGGRLLFMLIELVRRKPIDQKYEGIVHAIGFVLLMCMMLAVTIQDVIKLFYKG